MNRIDFATFAAAIKGVGKRLNQADQFDRETYTEYWFINGKQFARQIGAFASPSTYWSN